MMLERAINLADYLVHLQGNGRLCFTRGEALAATGLSSAAFMKAAMRLQRKHLLFTPRQGFYVVVPPQFHFWQAPPPSWYIDELMRHERRHYYVGLLKAAELHGATHNAVMEFQVMTDRQLPKIRAGRSYLVFYFRKEIEPVLCAVEQHRTATGTMAVSSVELTCLDLMRYANAVGGFSAVATILVDLGEKIDADKLVVLARHFERASLQRLGYLLDHLGHERTTEPLYRQLYTQPSVPWVKLDPARGANRLLFPAGDYAERNRRWRVVAQHLPEIDE